MLVPIRKNKSWVSRLHAGIDALEEDAKRAVMRPAGEACASDLLRLCEKTLCRKVESIEDLVAGWNTVRRERGLTGEWEIEGNEIRGVFGECGCPLVRSGLIELHPVQCYCSQGLMETVFSRVSGRGSAVELRRTIGRGDGVCDFLIKLQ